MLIRLCVLAFTAMLCAGPSVAGGVAQEQSPIFASICAEREVTVVTLLEDHGRAQDIPSAALAQADSDRMRAQSACYQSRVADAVALYDAIIGRLDPLVPAAR